MQQRKSDPPLTRSVTPIEDVAHAPHSGMCDAGQVIWVRDRSGGSRRVELSCTCAARLMALMADGPA